MGPGHAWQREDARSVSDAEKALLRASVVCNVALDAIPDPPQETAEAVEEPIREVCRRLEPFVQPLTDAEPVRRLN